MLSKILTHSHVKASNKPPITAPDETTLHHLPSAHSFAYSNHINNQQQQKEEEEKPPIITKELDEEANGYKARNPNFKSEYENLEKVTTLIQEQIRDLRKEISELKKAPIQRALTLHTDHIQKVDDTPKNDQGEHVGSKYYKNTQVEEQVEMLEQQLKELQSQEAQLRIKMIDMILEERKENDS
ncbi:hypothetical protein [Pseudoalteromonas luteoviolacea]|uniref:hypothetical protein n=1 Tax=Pseudoalteromonas luteoviolacea TaxID=43657 RepID=UPI00114EEB98|nr:hypothetical protein [Pseudoalteromonas luteoviolacea]TQF66764.1 hypothetical protein FLM44_24620 [Pseudoalteromonas luteoviolacea]